MIVPVMAISNLVLTRQIYSEETNGAHAHYREPVPLTAIVYFISTYYFGYDWIITIVGYSQHELSTVNMLYSLRKNCHITPLPLTATSPQQPLSSVPKLAVMGTFDCSLGLL